MRLAGLGQIARVWARAEASCVCNLWYFELLKGECVQTRAYQHADQVWKEVGCAVDVQWSQTSGPGGVDVQGRLERRSPI